MGLLVGLTGIISGCGHHHNDTAPAASGPSGTVLQGPVSGATVVAKKAGNNDFSKIEAGEVSTKTDASGNFKFQDAPPYSHTLVLLPDGVDTLTGKKNIQLIAKAGSQYITALTTLVATDPSGDVEAKLVALAGLPVGSSIGDVDTANTTAAAMILTKTIETAVSTLSETITKSAGTSAVSATQLAAVQTQTLQAISAEVAKAGVTLETLQAPSTLLDTVMTPAITAAATTIAEASNITITNTAAIADSIATAAVDSSAKVVNGATSGAADTAVNTDTAVIVESSKININAAAGSDAAKAVTAVNVAAAAAVTESSAPANMTVVVTPPAYVAPVIKTSLAPSIASVVLMVPASGNTTITVTFNHAVNNDGTFAVAGFTGSITFNEAGNILTFTTAARPAAGDLNITVDGYTADLSSAEAADNFSAALNSEGFIIIVPVIPTGTIGTSSGSNI